MAEGYTERSLPGYTRESWSDTEPVCAVRPVSFAYYMSETSEGISLDNLVRKKIHYTITPPPTLPRECIALLQFNYRR